MSKMDSLFSTFKHGRIDFLLALVLALLLMVGLGYWDWLSIEEGEHLRFFYCTLMSTLFFWLATGNRAWSVACFSGVVILSFYVGSGTGFTYGKLSSGIVVALLQTDMAEALEFAMMLSPLYITYAVGLIFFAYWYFLRRPRQRKFIVNAKKGWLVFFALQSLFIQFTWHWISRYKIYLKEETRLMQGASLPPSWGTVKDANRYAVNILVIGESVTSDHLSLYGYPVDTTPFLRTASALHVRTFITPSPGTIPSVPLLLSEHDDKKHVEPANNIVTLAKAAGFKTFWFSNQGYIGKNDTFISRIAVRSDVKKFLRLGDYKDMEADDLDLLPLLEGALKEPGKEFIVLHTIGSHPYACKRLSGYALQFPQSASHTLDCHLSSIHKMDSLMASAYALLRKDGRSFSLTYVADHGVLATTPGEADLFRESMEWPVWHIRHSNEYRNSFRVPLVFLASDIKQKKTLEKTLSGYDFLDIYANFIGLQTAAIDPAKSLETLPDNPDPLVYDWHNMVPYLNLPEYGN